jgi:diguanylate cyclase (GGDEF)-like protein/PAS domain S-box-containing protein
LHHWLPTPSTGAHTGSVRFGLVLFPTEVHRMAEEKEEQLRFQARLLDAVGQSVIATDLEGKVIYWNSAAEDLYGYSSEEALGRSLRDLTLSEELLDQAEGVASELRAGRTWSGETLLRRKDGSRVPVLGTATPVFDERGNLAGMIGVSADISERKALEAELERRASHDLLTDLPNHHAFIDRLGHALQRTRRKEDGPEVGVLFMDLDGFKTVNDSLGHEAGDRLLVAVAGRIKNLLRYEDTLARFGGDEFAVLLGNVEDPSEAIRVARRIAEGLREPFTIGDHRVSVSASVGIALGSAHANDDPEGMLRGADDAMYRAKEQGPGRYELFDPAMQARAQERLKLESALRRAVEQGEFVLHYQPIVSLGNGRMVGFEALLRWQHPKKGLQHPESFLHLAEETDLIVPIDGWVLQEVCRQAKLWEADYPSGSLMAMVNLSTRQLEGGGLARTIEEVLRQVALQVHTLALDITEGVLIKASEDNVQTLEDLKKMGIRLDLDDFGTGYSSLSYLKRFPVDGVKIDKSFVEGLGEDASDEALVGMIIDMCHTLDLDVVAEGIETPEQAALLKDMGCDLGQGYYFGRPLPSDQFAKRLPKAFPP